MPELEVLIILTWKYGFQNIQVLSHGFIPCSDWGLMDGRVEIDFKYWTAEWEKQQNAHVPNREERFQFMLDELEEMFSGEFTALDLGCGPGSLSRRLLERFPQAGCVALDYDPVLLFIGKNFEFRDEGRLSFVEANLVDASWPEKLPDKKFQAVLSTTALHWLPEESLKKTYEKISSILGPRGVFLNGDHLYPESQAPGLTELNARIRHRKELNALSDGKAPNWNTWWANLRKQQGLEELFRERDRRYPDSDHHDHPVSLERHMELLENAGFKETGVVWQNLDNRVLMALK
ncbi:MAG: class I SAM-dependent methyltransferase [Candidatus Thermoplasmatota archaeon]|nr:class I SAM-dependent methyltransferase [Candidatus Thermoplasmatota archaeon]